MRLIIKERQTVVFDFDGTLAVARTEVTPRIRELFRERLARHKNLAQIDDALGPPGYANAIKALFSEDERPEIWNEVLEQTIAQVDLGMALPKHLIPSLDRLARHHNLMVFSARDPVSLSRALKSAGIIDRFVFVEGYSGNYPPKPDPSGIEQLLNRLEIPLNRAVYVGDSKVDQLMAATAGMTFVAAGWMRDRILPSEAHHHCTFFDELPFVISALSSSRVSF